ncbi:protein O-mannosyl-transferase family [Candidatus Zixiibacteriota bacterium]
MNDHLENSNLRDLRTIGAWFIGIVTLAVYALTVAPTVAFWDVGEFIATSFNLAIPHPPGAPTFVLLGRLFTLLPTPFNVAAEVNLISVLAGTATVLLLYGIILEVLHLMEKGRQTEEGINGAIHVLAAGTGALAFAFSHSAWFNSVEAEVYSISLMVTALCLWLVLRHLRGGGDRSRASLLLLIGYLLGIGTGNHLLALLTIPSILILLWYFDRDVLKRREVWVGSVLLFLIGYSVYALIFIRSGMDPPIDMNNPESWENFMLFLQRRQYGSESMLLNIFNRKADLFSYQLDYHFLRYFRTEFWQPFYLLAIAGALTNLTRDRRSFFANGALWLVMGLGLVLYLNMPDPQPRDRDYIYLGCYFATAIWIGIGMVGVADVLRKWLSRFTPRTIILTIAMLGFALTATQLGLNFQRHDRSGDYIAWDYGYNMLQSCPANAILFTNGDNDTYPLWYLQTVEGIRLDVRVVNLSLLNTGWYIKELRDREPKVPIQLSDREIDTEMGVAAFAQDSTFSIAGIDWNVPGNTAIRIQDQMVVHIIAANNWQRPVYFAITVPTENQAWFSPYLQLEGFAFSVLPQPQRVELDITLHNLKEVFQYRGIVDPRIYKDENATTLLHNYRVVFQETADALLQKGNTAEALALLEWGSQRVDLTAPDYKAYWAMVTMARGDTARAITMFEESLAGTFELPGNKIRSYSSLIFARMESGDIPKAALVLDQWFRQIAGSSDPPGEEPLEELELGMLIDSSEADVEMVQALLMLMHFFASTGEYERSAWVVEKWLERAPDDNQTRAWLDELRSRQIPEDLLRLALRFIW